MGHFHYCELCDDYDAIYCDVPYCEGVPDELIKQHYHDEHDREGPKWIL